LTLLVHPARQEPLGRVLLEAAAAGRAIVATDVGGTREIFPPESDAACLVPPDDVVAMARAIEELLHDPARRLRLGANARTRIESHFTVELAIAGLLRHYGSAISAV
jgi:glycosyltransferase involved in cell wall biosynthesis